MRKIILFFQIIIITLLPVALYAQNKTVTGTVRDVGGVLPGSTIVEKGMPGNIAVADGNGKFKITLQGSSNTLIVKFIGYDPQEYKVSSTTKSVDITLSANSQSLTEVVVTGFGSVKRITMTGAASSISAAVIRTVPTANVQNALTGRLPGFFSQQTSGQPGKDASDFFIRGVSSLNAAGNQPLIIVDDIEYSYDQLQQININEIESITILKDASTTAIYGIKGANGVLVVTTRRGKTGSPRFNLRVEGGVAAPTKTPQFLDSYHTAVLINEAQKNDGIQQTFSQQDLDLFQNGTDPYGHPNVNWYNEIFRKNNAQANTNLDISGGTEQVKYFISGGALTQNGLNKDFSDPANLVNTNYVFKRYNFRSNLDLQANKTLSFRLDITTRFSDLNQPHALGSLAQVYDFKAEEPFSSPVLNPNGSYAYAVSPFIANGLPTLNARLATGGYDHSRRTDYNVLLGATQNLEALTQGLTLTARVAYSSIEQFTKSVQRGSIPSFHYNPINNLYTLNPSGTFFYSHYGQFGDVDVSQSNLNLQLFANYDRTFGAHHFTGLLLFNQTAETFYDQAGLGITDIGVPQKFRGISAKVGYDYKGKYLFDFNMGYNGTDRFAAAHRYGFFPAVSAGYRISEEAFFKKAFPIFSLFKIRGSYGLVGSDVVPGNRYIYNQLYNKGGVYSFGESQQNTQLYSEGSLGNANVTWEKAKKADIGLDMNLLHDKVSITFDVFHDIRYDQLFTPGSVPLLIGIGLPAVNIAKTQNEGFDGQISYNGSIGKLQFNTGFVFSYAKNKILFEDEASPTYPWLARTGHSINQPFGYQSLGYYSVADIAEIKQYITTHGNNTGNTIAVPDYAATDPNSTVQPGDLKYKDLNGDGIINVFDRTAIGNPNLPNTTLGLSLGVNYKGFSLSILFQGSYGYSFAIVGTGIEPFVGQFQPIHEQRWTPATAETAQFPRLATNATTVNSPGGYLSDYWLVNARYIRLKTVDLGYQVPTTLLPFKVSNARIYLSAYNLFTWTNYKKYQQDPEIATNTAGDAYINQRVINLGLQVGF